MLDPGSCCTTKLSDVKGVATTHQPRDGKEAMRDLRETDTKTDFVFLHFNHLDKTAEKKKILKTLFSLAEFLKNIDIIS